MKLQNKHGMKEVQDKCQGQMKKSMKFSIYFKISVKILRIPALDFTTFVRRGFNS